MPESRARRSIFTVSVGGSGKEHRLQGVSGLQHSVELIDPVSASTRLDQYVLPAQFNMGNITFKEAPFDGCGDQPAGNFYFQVLLNGNEIAHVRSISGLGVHWAISENRESTSLNVQKLFEKRSMPEITLSQVIELSEGNPLYEEISKLGKYQGPGKAYSVVGGATCDYRGDWTIILKNRAGGSVVKWNFYSAFPSQYTPINDLEATASDVGLRSLVLRSSPAVSVTPLEETVSSYPTKGLVSTEWQQWIAGALKLPTRKDLVVKLYGPDAMPGSGSAKRTWKLFNCWPSEINYQDLDASSPALATREIVMACDGYIES